MITKSNDKTFVDRPELFEKISNADVKIDMSALETYYHYLTERHKVYKKKETGLPKPWTEDIIIQTNSFTNDIRRLDKTSKWLISNIINNDKLTYEDKIWRTILFRLYNKIETAELIGLADPDFWYSNHVERSAIVLSRTDCDPFSRAYKIIAIKYSYRDTYCPELDWKPSLFLHVVSLYNKYTGKIPNELEDSGESCMLWLHNNIRGCGDFISYQVFVDLSYIKEFPLSDEWTVVAGPGCIAGIDMLCTDRDGLSYEEFLYWEREHIDELFKSIDPEYDVHKLFDDQPKEYQYWGLNAIENSHCEFSKYMYLREGKHKKPRRYNGIVD